jgi:hypothetical protein
VNVTSDEPPTFDAVARRLPWVVATEGPAGPVLCARGRLVIAPERLQETIDALGDRVRLRTELPLGFELVFTSGDEDPVVLAQEVRAEPVHVLTAAAAWTDPPDTAEQQTAMLGELTAEVPSVVLGAVTTDIVLAQHLLRAGEGLPLVLPYAGWSFDNAAPSYLWRCVRWAHEHGSILVAPAGDTGTRRPVWPAASVLAVAGLDATGLHLTASSARGVWVDVAAPGGTGPGAGTLVAAVAAVAALADEPPADAQEVLGRRWALVDGDVAVRPGDSRFDDVLRARGSGGVSTAHPPRRRRDPGVAYLNDPDRAGWSYGSDRAEDGAQWVTSTTVADSSGTLSTDTLLVTGRTYAVRLHVGSETAVAALELVAAPLSLDVAPPGSELEVVVVPLAGCAVVGSDTVTFRLPEVPRGSPVVASVDVEALQVGTARLRLMLYRRGSLLQSRLLTCEVADGPGSRPGALTAEVDYTRTTALSARYLDDLAPVDVTLLLNSSDGGATHDLVYRTPDGAQRGATRIDGQALDTCLRIAREALHRVSWGTDDEYLERADQAVRYAPSRSESGFFDDLARLALAGARLWSALVVPLGSAAGLRSDDARTALAAALRRPGTLELSSKAGLRLTVPIALLYDQPLDDSAVPTLCPAFVATWQSHGDLATTPCFQGACPTYDDDQVACPSGFWGYRHALAVPVSVTEPTPEGVPSAGDDPGDAVAAVHYDEAPVAIAATTTDDAFVGREAHLAQMTSLFDGKLTVASDRDAALAGLPMAPMHAAYFFCHGVMDRDGYPALVVGPKEGRAITLTNVASRIRWTSSRPLVFLNGCRTAALLPSSPFSLVTTLLTECRAAGVVGTEVTVFEQTAIPFAEAFHRAWVGGAGVGDAIRTARVALLAAGNPLGLVYTPYASVGLRLVRDA